MSLPIKDRLIWVDEYEQALKKEGGHRALGDILDSIEELKY